MLLGTFCLLGPSHQPCWLTLVVSAQKLGTAEHPWVLPAQNLAAATHVCPQGASSAVQLRGLANDNENNICVERKRRDNPHKLGLLSSALMHLGKESDLQWGERKVSVLLIPDFPSAFTAEQSCLPLLPATSSCPSCLYQTDAAHVLQWRISGGLLVILPRGGCVPLERN